MESPDGWTPLVSMQRLRGLRFGLGRGATGQVAWSLSSRVDSLMKDPPHQEHEPRQHATRGARVGAEDLFRQHSSFVARFLHHLGVPPADLDDLVQDVFLVAHRKGGHDPTLGQARTWLGAIAVNLHRARARAGLLRNAKLEELSQGAASSLAPRGGDASDQVVSRQLLQRVLEVLDFEHRATFILYEVEGQSCEAIARALGVPLGTVYSRLHHARRRVMREYAALTSEPAPSGSPLLESSRLTEGP